MPYRVTANGVKVEYSKGLEWKDLTDWQKQVLSYLVKRTDEGDYDYIPAHDIGYDLKEHPRAISGIAYSLIKRGLVEKKE